MDQIFSVITSPEFRLAMYSLSIVCILLAIGISIAAFAFYGRAQETRDVPPDQEKWVLLFASWRDSLIITLLYTADNLSYKFSDFSGLSESMADSIFLYAPIVQPIFSFVLQVLMLAVVVMRTIVISRWLAKQ